MALFTSLKFMISSDKNFLESPLASDRLKVLEIILIGFQSILSRAGFEGEIEQIYQVRLEERNTNSDASSASGPF